MPRLLHSLNDSCAANVETAASWPTILVEFPDSFSDFWLFSIFVLSCFPVERGHAERPSAILRGTRHLIFRPRSKRALPLRSRRRGPSRTPASLGHLIQSTISIAGSLFAAKWSIARRVAKRNGR